MRPWIKTALFVSAFSPALISLAVARWWAHGFSFDVAYYLFGGFFGSLSVTYILSAIRYYGEAYSLKIKKIEPNDTLFLGVVSTYFFPFIGRAADITILPLLCIVAAVAVVLWISNAIAPSPLMGLLRYRFYKAESEKGFVYTLITKRDLVDPSQVTLVKKITANMLVEAE